MIESDIHSLFTIKSTGSCKSIKECNDCYFDHEENCWDLFEKDKEEARHLEKKWKKKYMKVVDEILLKIPKEEIRAALLTFEKKKSPQEREIHTLLYIISRKHCDSIDCDECVFNKDDLEEFCINTNFSDGRKSRLLLKKAKELLNSVPKCALQNALLSYKEREEAGDFKNDYEKIYC